MRVLLLLIITSFSAGVFAQEPAKLIFWTGDPECGFRSRSFTAADEISCTTVQTARGPVSQVSVNGLSLAAAFLEKDENIIVGTRITNKTPDPVMFDSDLWGAAHFRTKAGFYAKEGPIVAETSIPTRDMIRSVIFGTKMGAVGDKTIADGQVKGETREIRRSDGTRYKVDMIVPDKDAQSATARRSEAEMERVVAEQARIRSTALTAKSVRGDDFVQGLVYFRRVKEADFVVFSLKVGDTTFIFQLPSKSK